MKNLLTSLNGWQRGFVFFVIFFYVPITVLLLSEVESTQALKYTDEELNLKIFEYQKKEKIDLNVQVQNRWDKVVYKFAPLPDYVPEKSDLILVEYSSSSSNINYLVTFDYKKDRINFDQDVEVKKLSKFIQETIDNNEVVEIKFEEYVEILLVFFILTLGTYFFGFMIGWVVKGFRQK